MPILLGFSFSILFIVLLLGGLSVDFVHSSIDPNHPDLIPGTAFHRKTLNNLERPSQPPLGSPHLAAHLDDVRFQTVIDNGNSPVQGGLSGLEAHSPEVHPQPVAEQHG
ncbi:hypothetical protein BV898_18904 [Hypsibius exemplaris]|uniref:Uncharacterized protein n=1 Tax=Hypsibius exemplaris TaxID=2072580 RepID=A0A9X6NQT9_HYPEX|nr:hypothetical protein BV898_18904 [Hypsibius exemplaris]